MLNIELGSVEGYSGGAAVISDEQQCFFAVLVPQAPPNAKDFRERGPGLWCFFAALNSEISKPISTKKLAV